MRNIYLITLLLLPGFLSAQWTTQATGFADSLIGLQHISVVDENIVWATAYDGSSVGAVIQQFTRTTNGGATWMPGIVSGVPGYVPNMIFALNADTAWVMYYDPVNDGGKILRTNDGGQTWTHQSTALFTDSLEAYPNLIYFWNANEGVAMGDPTNGYFEIYTTNNGGTLWTRVPSSNMPALISGEWGYEGKYSVIGNTILFGTSKGRLYKSVNKGYNWTAVNTPLLNSGKARIVEFRDSLHGIISDRVNNALVMYETSDGGNNWQLITPVGPVYFNDLQYVPNTPASYVSTGDKPGYTGASISHDGGHTWIEISSPIGNAYGTSGFSSGMLGWASQLNHGPAQGGVARYTILSSDAGLWYDSLEIPKCSGTDDVICHVKNNGVGLLNSVELHWSVNGVQQPTNNISLSLLPNMSTSVTAGTYAFIANTGYNIQLFTAMPNGMNDTTNANDTVLFSTIIHPAPQVNLGPDTSIHAGNSIILDAGPGYASYWWSTGETTQTITVDSSGIGTGSKQVTVQVIDILGCGGTDTIIIGFHINPGSDDATDISSDLLLYPNPVRDVLYIGSRVPKIDDLWIYDLSGRKLISIRQPDRGSGIDLSALSPGIYVLVLESSAMTITRKIMVVRP